MSTLWWSYCFHCCAYRATAAVSSNFLCIVYIYTYIYIYVYICTCIFGDCFFLSCCFVLFSFLRASVTDLYKVSTFQKAAAHDGVGYEGNEKDWWRWWWWWWIFIIFPQMHFRRTVFLWGAAAVGGSTESLSIAPGSWRLPKIKKLNSIPVC